MDLERALEILKNAEGDEAGVRLASVDLQFPELPEAERARLRDALEAASVPHWFDDRILAALLEVSPEEAARIAVQLRQLSVVQAFSARGPGAANVHEKLRLALRARMKKEAPEKLRVLSIRARSSFAGAEPHLQIEAVYHRFTAEPEAAAWECGGLFDQWNAAGRYEALLALGVALDELVSAGLPVGLPRGVALYHLARIRYDYQPRDYAARQAADALSEFESAKDSWLIANTQDLLGNVEFDRGNLETALAWLRRSLATWEQLVAESPEDTLRQRNLSVSYNKVGDVQSAQGDLDGALKSYRDSLAIRHKLANQDPGNAGWQRGLSVSYIKVGDVQSAQGDLDGALKSYRDSLAIADKLAKQDPGNAQWQYDLGISHERLGSVFEAQGNLDEALKEYRAKQALIDKLAKQDPANAGWQRDLSVTYNKVGDVQSAQGDLDAALKSYRDSLAIADKLAKLDPGNASLQYDLGISHERLGSVFEAQGKLDEALKEYRAKQALIDKLAKQEPGNAGWQRDLSVTYNKVGDVQSAQGDLDAALKSYRDSLAIAEKLAKQDPGNAGWQRDLSVSYQKIAYVQENQEDFAAAAETYRKSLSIVEKLARQDPANAQWQGDLGWNCWAIGRTLIKADPKLKADARAMVKKGRDILRQLKVRTGLTAQQQQWLDAIEADVRDTP
jgi:tetratricopeptide (TPR) repeat protein